MKVLIGIPANSPKIKAMAEVIQEEFTSDEARVNLLEIGSDEMSTQEKSKHFSGVDLVILGSPVYSWSGGISVNLTNFIDNCSFIAGKKVALIIEKNLFGCDKAMKNLMAAVEEQGGILIDFEILSNTKNALKFASRLPHASGKDKGI